MLMMFNFKIMLTEYYSFEFIFYVGKSESICNVFF